MIPAVLNIPHLCMLDVLYMLFFISFVFNYGAKVSPGVAAKNDVVTCKK